jgi:hypothetical protein
MKGYNQRFMNDPQGFLQAVKIDCRIDGLGPQFGRKVKFVPHANVCNRSVDFDLVPNTAIDAIEQVILQDYRSSFKRKFKSGNRIPAYFIPYVDGDGWQHFGYTNVAVNPGDDDVKYVFTPGFTGCTLVARIMPHNNIRLFHESTKEAWAALPFYPGVAPAGNNGRYDIPHQYFDDDSDYIPCGAAIVYYQGGHWSCTIQVCGIEKARVAQLKVSQTIGSRLLESINHQIT